MHVLPSPRLILPFLLHIHLALSQNVAISPTTIHFFPRTSCNRGTSLSYTTVADLYDDNTCHTTPVGTEALYIDGIVEGCAVMAFSDSACSPSALLTQSLITAGICQFYGSVGNSIGAWMGVCGAGAAAGGGANADVSSSGTVVGEMVSSTMAGAASTGNGNTNATVTMTAMTAMSMSVQGNGTVVVKTARLQTPTSTNPPSLQGSAGAGVANSGVAGMRLPVGRIREGEDWMRWMVVKALLAMGGVEVLWGFV